MNKGWILLMLVTLLLGACEADRVKPIEDILPPEIKINSPLAGEVFENGASIQILVELSDNDALHQVELKLIRQRDISEVFSEIRHSHAEKEFQLFLYNAHVKEDTEFEIKIKAQDHHKNISYKNQFFSVKK